MVIGNTNMKTELANVGYSVKQLDEWPAKAILYRHKPAYNTEGTVTDEVGTFVENVPGSPDYILRKSRIGMFTFPPSEACECKWCRERAASTPKRDNNGKFVKKK